MARDVIELVVFVPKEGTLSFIDKGSAIVGTPGIDDLVTVCYEGDRFGFCDGDFEAMCKTAAGRLVENYPTIARARLPRTELTPIGFYYHGGLGLTVSDPAALTAWLGHDRWRSPMY